MFCESIEERARILSKMLDNIIGIANNVVIVLEDDWADRKVEKSFTAVKNL